MHDFFRSKPTKFYGDLIHSWENFRVLLTFLQMDKRVIRGIYLYEFKLGTTAKEADEKINAAFGQGCSTIRTAYRWYQKFRNGDESLEEHEGRGRHKDDPHKGTREIAKVLGVSHNTAARPLKEIGKTKKCNELNEQTVTCGISFRSANFALPVILLTFLQMDKRVIRGIYLYEFKLGTTAKEADEKINAAFGQGCSTIRTAYRWYQKFRNGDESRGRHSDVDEDKLRDVVEDDPHKGTREIAKVLGVSHNTLERWVPHELSEEQRSRRYEISSALLLRNETDPFLDRIVTCDEKWIMYDNRRRSAQWSPHSCTRVEIPTLCCLPEIVDSSHIKNVGRDGWAEFLVSDFLTILGNFFLFSGKIVKKLARKQKIEMRAKLYRRNSIKRMQKVSYIYENCGRVMFLEYFKLQETCVFWGRVSVEIAPCTHDSRRFACFIDCVSAVESLHRTFLAFHNLASHSILFDFNSTWFRPCGITYYFTHIKTARLD
ncbi:unnamed protein product [Heligmosomoides polygyrus]|uniref:Mos1 transposase HTH domain-containing protein n=1 Tax=Heligmosomoides polygyrus TaxID=6339 RepID=A0A3P8AES5_HELPZ|nr:unnamed protein product [Heligmosomoides polygyrus]